MKLREAQIEDISDMHRIRMAVKENVLTNPQTVQEVDYIPFLTEKGKGWVLEIDDKIMGFSIVDLEKAEIWALFVDPNNEGLGIGGELHDAMVTWYFGQGKTELILGTEPGTRAEGFYLHRGWVAAGHKSNGEIIFKMSRKDLLLLS